MSQNTTKLNEKEKIPFGSKEWVIKYADIALYLLFAMIGYAIHYNLIDINQNWILDFNHFMSIICPQVSAIAKFETNIIMNQFYFGLMWLIGTPVLVPICLRNYKKKVRQNPAYSSVLLLFFGTCIFCIILLPLLMLSKKSFLLACLNSDWLSPLVAPIFTIGTQMFCVGAVYSLFVLIKNFKRFILGANDVR